MSEPAPRANGDQEPMASAIRLFSAWMENWRAFRDQPGASVAVVDRQGAVWTRGYGLANRERGIAADADTIYRIASISKVFTSIAVMQLRDAGAVSLDAPLSTYLPWFSIQGETGSDVPVTLRGILTHTSGLPREAAFPYWEENEFPTHDEIVHTIPSQELAHPAATRWKYSNLGFTLAGEVIEAVSGKSYSDYLNELILGPLGMESTAVEVPEKLRDRLAVGYGRRFPEIGRAVRPFSDLKGVTAAGGLCSSVRDLSRFAAFLLNPSANPDVLRPATLRQMQRVHWLRPDWRGGWGLGFGITRQGERDLVGHGGWLAGYQSALSTCPSEGLAVIALCNSDDSLPYIGTTESVADRLWKWPAAAAAEAVRAPVPDPTPEPHWQAFTGRYRSHWGDREVLILRGRLVLISPSELDPLGTRAFLDPRPDGSFRTRSEAPFGEDGDIVRFERAPDGRVTHMRTGQNRSARMETWSDPPL